jgi:hypothetical protein
VVSGLLIGGGTCPPFGHEYLRVAQRKIEHVPHAMTREIDAVEEFCQLAGQSDSHWGTIQ